MASALPHACSATTGADWILVGISGVTSGGKTQLTDYLLKRFRGSLSLNQDTFFRAENDPHHEMIPELNHANWECLSSVHWDKLQQALEDGTSQRPAKPSLFIVEGHLVFNHPQLVKKFRRKYFFTLTKDQCRARRQLRTYDPPDPPGYFDLVVWPMYLRNKRRMERSVTDVAYLDGSESAEEICRTVEGDLLRSWSELETR